MGHIDGTVEITRAEWLAGRPAWAEAAIVAVRETNESDSMTDYFATRGHEVVFLAWSKHKRDLFSEMRKAAETFPLTAHLGTGKSVVTVRVVLAEDAKDGGSRAYWAGSVSPWHGDLYGDEDAGYGSRGKSFTTRGEAEAWIADQPEPHPITISGNPSATSFKWDMAEASIEHREKYSMGSGYYLKGSGHYSDGWKVKKTWIEDRADGTILIVAPSAPAPVNGSPVVAALDGVTLTENRERNGIELRFPAKPSASVRDRLKVDGWRWSRFSACWYHRDTPAARASAATFLVVSE